MRFCSFGSSQFRRSAQRQDRCETGEQLSKRGIILPGGQFTSLETIRQLLIGHQGLFCLVGSDADQGDAKVIGQEPNGIEENALLTKGSSQHRVDLVYDQHAYFQLPRRDTRSMA